MPSFDYDFLVIGAGSGGVRAARIAAGHGARVAVAEDGRLGGTCVNLGCVPKKLLAYAAHFSHDLHDAVDGYGWSIDAARHDWPTLIAAKDREIYRLNGVYRRLLEGAGATILDGRARFVDAHAVEVGGRRVTAETILIATGGRPVLPDQPGAREHGITSDQAFSLPSLPHRAVVVGGGYIAVEFAGIFRGLGAEVIQLCRGARFLRGFDDDVRTFLAEEIVKTGIDLRFSTTIERIEKASDCLVVHLTDGAQIEAGLVLFAVGRRPNTDGLNLEAAGVRTTERGAVIVDETFRTSAAGIYAIGDVIDRLQLTPVALAEGHALADTLFGGRPRKVDYSHVPTAVFSIPPVATVGLTEAKARETHGEVDIYRSTFRPLKQTVTGHDERTMMKLVVERRSDRVLGCHMVGFEAPEIIQGLAVALTCGATKVQFDATLGIHPTVAEEFVTMRTRSPDPIPEPLDEAAE